MALGAFGLTANGAASDLSITAPGTTICTPVTDLVGMQALRVALRFLWGSGGTNVRAFVQTSEDGNIWDDIACVLFGIESESVRLNFSALTPKAQTTPTDGAMADDTLVDGLIATQVRLKVVSTGIYAGNTLLSARITAR
jgi:hypothetical protein